MEYDEAFEILISVGMRHGVRPDVPMESESFFRELVANYSGQSEDFLSWVNAQVLEFFRYAVRPPVWLQGPEWPIFGGHPMMFIGQIDLPIGSNDLFDHDASYYVFLDRETGTIKTIGQAV